MLPLQVVSRWWRPLVQPSDMEDDDGFAETGTVETGTDETELGEEADGPG
jgi:hypothetical protein